jgi:hypothetical protein
VAGHCQSEPIKRLTNNKFPRMLNPAMAQKTAPNSRHRQLVKRVDSSRSDFASVPIRNRLAWKVLGNGLSQAQSISRIEPRIGADQISPDTATPPVSVQDIERELNFHKT